MNKHIDADELRARMYHEAFETDSDMQRWDSGCWIRYKMFENALEQIPAADVQEVLTEDDVLRWCEPKNYALVAKEDLPKLFCGTDRHGRWILGGEEGWPKWTCSVCGGDGRGDYTICPWCGALMDNKEATK